VPATSFITELPGQTTLFHPYRGGWLASLRLPPGAGRHQSRDR